MQSLARAYCGVLNVAKPSGETSRWVVDRVSRPLRKTKVGHAGTLDPLASGVLVVCVGAATRLIELVQRMPKTYRTVVRLGATSDTLDADGQVVYREDCRVPEPAEVHEAVATQVGTILQLPPEFSALKVAGRRAYDLAREGREVVLEPRPVTIYRIDVLNYEWPRLTLQVECGGGTYIRSIARDVGERLGCGGMVEVLIRTRIGGFCLEDAVKAEDLSLETIPGWLRPSLEAAAALPKMSLSPDEVAAVAQGRWLAPDPDDPRRVGDAVGEMALVGPDGQLAAVGEWVEGGTRIIPRRVLTTA